MEKNCKSLVAVISGILWKLWKQSKHANLIVSDESVMNKLRSLIGKEYLREAQDDAGPEIIEEFCDSVRHFLHMTQKKYYGGIIELILKVWDGLNGRLERKKYSKQHSSEFELLPT